MDKILRFIKNFLKGMHEKWIVRTLIGTGTAILLAGFTQNVWLSFLLSVFNDQLDRNIPDPQDSIDLWIYLLVGGILVAIGLIFYFKTKSREKTKHLLLIQHSSIEAASYTNVEEEFPDYQLEPYQINQVLELANLNRDSLSHALREQEKSVQRIRTRMDGKLDIETAYLGLAHIPLMFLIGYQMADKSVASFMEWNQNKLRWDKITNNTNTVYPALLLEKKLVQDIDNTTDVVIKIGISYPVPDSDLQGLGLESLNSYYLHLDQPRRNAIISFEQLQYYKKTFRDLLDEINKQFLNTKRVHVFYSGQPSLAYCLGSSLSNRMDPETWVYNHTRNSYPKYKWAVKMTTINKPVDFKIVEEMNQRV